jgi:hypothetical protein
MWDKTYGGTEWDRGPSLVATSDGGYALAGYAGYVGPFSAGSGDFWLVKTEAEDTTEPSPTDGTAIALPIEYAYVAVIAVLIVVVLIAVIAYRKRK